MRDPRRCLVALLQLALTATVIDIGVAVKASNNAAEQVKEKVLLLPSSISDNNGLVAQLSKVVDLSAGFADESSFIDEEHRALSTVCSSNADCGTDCRVALAPGCFYTFSDSTSFVTCPDKCGTGRRLQIACTTYCSPTGFGGYCLQQWACGNDSADQCVGECSTDDLCAPIGCAPGDIPYTGGGDTPEQDVACQENGDGTFSCLLEGFPIAVLATSVNGCTLVGSTNQVVCDSCAVKSSATGTQCNSCTICDADLNISYDCGNVPEATDCPQMSCDGTCIGGPPDSPETPGSPANTPGSNSPSSGARLFLSWANFVLGASLSLYMMN